MADQSALMDQILPTAWRLSVRYRWVIEFALLTLIALLLVQLFWAMFAPTHPSRLDARPLPAKATSGPSEVLVYADKSQLARINPFGSSSSDEIDTSAPETSLNLILESLFMSTTGPMGSVSIRLPNNEVAVFRPGDEILDGIYLERILSDRVILNRNGSREVLLKFGRSGGFRALDQNEPIGEPSSVDTLGEEDVLQGQAQSPRTLLLNLEMTPVLDGVEVTGLSLMPKGSVELMAAAALAPGDVLVAIDGTEISEIDQSQLIADLQNRRSVSLDILRNNIRREVRLTFSE